jgi:hypothetical protein
VPSRVVSPGKGDRPGDELGPRVLSCRVRAPSYRGRRRGSEAVCAAHTHAAAGGAFARLISRKTAACPAPSRVCSYSEYVNFAEREEAIEWMELESSCARASESKYASIDVGDRSACCSNPGTLFLLNIDSLMAA